MRKFPKWIAAYPGGVEKLALDLGVSSFAVRYWKAEKGIPRIATAREILKRSRGQLTFEDIILPDYPQLREKTAKAVRRKK